MQWEGWLRGVAILEGRGTAPQIQRAYGWLASGYREGDRIFLFGYSRGAYAVRSLAGVIDRVGLLKREHATERAVRLAWRHYERRPTARQRQAFARRFCHPEAPDRDGRGLGHGKGAGAAAAAVLDVRDRPARRFTTTTSARAIRHGYHALALNETREAFAPVLWDCPPGWEGNVEQVWFRGAHGDVGGQIGEFAAARPLANIPLVWMLDRAEALGLALPEGWRARLPCDPDGADGRHLAQLGQGVPVAPPAGGGARPVGTAAPQRRVRRAKRAGLASSPPNRASSRARLST